MKITKRQLRRIIKEERSKLLKEMRRPMTTHADTLEFAMDEYIQSRVSEGEDDPSRLHREIMAVADELLANASLSTGKLDGSRY